MKKSILLGIFLLSLSCLINGQSTYPSGVTGCIARWTFDTTESSVLTNLPDMSGNNNNGITYNITSVPGFRNKPNSAGGFNGTSSWAEVMHDAMLNPNEVTIISLIKFSNYYDSICQVNQILSKGYPHFIAGNYGQAVADSPYDLDCNAFNPNKEQMITQKGVVNLTPTAGNYIPISKWYFLASVIGSSSVIQYQMEMDTNFKAPNLTPINSLSSSNTIGSNTQNISIGRHLNPNYPYWVEGAMDEIILFNKALNNSEIYSVYSYLWGNPLTDNSVEFHNEDFSIIKRNENLEISTNSKNYNIEIFNLVGQCLIKQCNLTHFNLVNLSVYKNENLILKITNNIDRKIIIKKIY